MFRLALALGCSVREVERMSAAEFDEWARYYAVEPFGSERDNLHAGIIAAVVANSIRGFAGGKGQQLTPSDFMLLAPDERRERSLAAGVRQLRAMAKRKKGKR